MGLLCLVIFYIKGFHFLSVSFCAKAVEEKKNAGLIR